MFFGHIAAGLAAKTVFPKIPLGVTLVSAAALDSLTGVFVTVGMERFDVATSDSYLPWSHGLFMSVVWAVAAFALAYLISRDRRTSLGIGLLVFSHWALDFISHPMFSTVPDLPLLFEGSPKVGLGLYSTVAPAMITEFALLAAGSALYLARTQAIDRTGRWVFWALPVFLVVLMGVLSAAPDASSLLSLLAVTLGVPLIGVWIDRHRAVRAALPRPEQRLTRA